MVKKYVNYLTTLKKKETVAQRFEEALKYEKEIKRVLALVSEAKDNVGLVSLPADADADALVKAGNGNSNYGSSPELMTKDDNSGNTRWAYMRFDVSKATSKGFRIKSAVLHLTCTESKKEGGNGALYLVENDNWEESTITWKTRVRELLGKTLKNANQPLNPIGNVSIMLDIR